MIRHNNHPRPHEWWLKARYRIRRAALDARIEWLSPLGRSEKQRAVRVLK